MLSTQRAEGRRVSDQGREAHLGSVLRYALAAASFGAGAVHFTATFDHAEHVVVAAFFVVLTLLQVGWAAAVVRRPSAGLLNAGAVMSAGVVVIWLLSRTTGLPGVPGAEEPEPFGLKDGTASLLELLLAAGIAAQFVPRAQGLRIASGRLASALAVSVVAVLTAAGLSAPGHGHHHGGGAHAHGAEGHSHDSASAGQAEPAHAHDGGGGHDDPAGHDHDSSSVAPAAGAADHDHNAPGHVHDPSHHHAPGHVHDPSHHHAPGHVHDPSHHHDQSGHSDQAGGNADPRHGHGDGGHHQESGGHHHEGSGHDHGSGDHRHGGGDGDAEGCTSPLPANQAVTTLQQTAQSTIGAGCRLQTSSPTGDPHRHSSLRRSPEHFIS